MQGDVTFPNGHRSSVALSDVPSFAFQGSSVIFFCNNYSHKAHSRQLSIDIDVFKTVNILIINIIYVITEEKQMAC